MNTPIGIPSGWENSAAYWSHDWERDCLIDEITSPMIGSGCFEPLFNDLCDWREEPSE